MRTFQPGEGVRLREYMPPRLAWLEKTSDEPRVESGVEIATLTDETYELRHFRRGTLSLLALGGDASARLADDGEPIYLPAGTAVNLSRSWARTGKVRVEGSVQLVWEEE
jgi:hypothetical protein